jgi:hypothetical protein
MASGTRPAPSGCARDARGGDYAELPLEPVTAAVRAGQLGLLRAGLHELLEKPAAGRARVFVYWHANSEADFVNLEYRTCRALSASSGCAGAVRARPDRHLRPGAPASRREALAVYRQGLGESGLRWVPMSSAAPGSVTESAQAAGRSESVASAPRGRRAVPRGTALNVAHRGVTLRRCRRNCHAPRLPQKTVGVLAHAAQRGILLNSRWSGRQPGSQAEKSRWPGRPFFGRAGRPPLGKVRELCITRIESAKSNASASAVSWSGCAPGRDASSSIAAAAWGERSTLPEPPSCGPTAFRSRRTRSRRQRAAAMFGDIAP